MVIGLSSKDLRSIVGFGIVRIHEAQARDAIESAGIEKDSWNIGLAHELLADGRRLFNFWEAEAELKSG